MQLAQLILRIGSVTAHHQVGNDLYVMLLQYQNIGSVKPHRIFDLDKHTRTFVLIHQIVPPDQLNFRGGYVNLFVYKRIQRGSRRPHANISHLAYGILIHIRKHIIFRRLPDSLTVLNIPRFIVRQTHSGE